MTDNADVSKLRDLYDSIETNVRNLKTLGITSESFAPVIIPTILSKVPECICHVVMKITREKDWDFDAVLESIQNEVVAREQCKLMGRAAPQTKKTESRDQYSTGASLYSSQHDKGNKAPWCVYCGENHKAWKCNRVTEVGQRREILKKDKRCFNCLRKNCRINECKSPFKCFTCQGKHHNSIHPPTTSSHEEESSRLGGNGCLVLLKTARTEISSLEMPSKSMTARVILDDCSQRSYITRSLSKKLNLKVLSSKEVMVKGICGKSTVVNSEIVEFFLQTKSGNKMKITAGVLDEICDPISQPSVKTAVKNYPHLQDIAFADYHDGNEIDIQILIGGDFYYEIVSSTVKRGPPGTPVAVSTKLGWMIGGPAKQKEIIHTNLASVSLRTSETCEIYETQNREILEKTWAKSRPHLCEKFDRCKNE